MKPEFRLRSELASLCLALVLGIGLGGTLLPKSAKAEWVFSFYTGANFSPDSAVDYDFNLGAGRQSTTVSWDGEPFEMPPYFGLRATWWSETNPAWGFAIDNVHAKVAASPMPAGFSTLEFTDGINIVTGNLHYRFQNDSRFTPYVGAGIGFTTPHVEVTNSAGSSRTSEYQFGGPAVQALIGVDAEIDDRWSMFGELKSAYVWISADLTGGGSLSADFASHQIAFGVSYKLKKR